MTPPLPPPNGTSATAHFQVIQAASALTSSSVTSGDSGCRPCRAERDVVLDAVAGEHLDFAVVHLDRAGDGDLPLRMGQDLPDARVEPEQARRAVELLEHRVENAAACCHVTPGTSGSRYRGRPDWSTGQATVPESPSQAAAFRHGRLQGSATVQHCSTRSRGIAHDKSCDWSAPRFWSGATAAAPPRKPVRPM